MEFPIHFLGALAPRLSISHGCVTSIATIRSSLTSTESDQSLSTKEKVLLIAEYQRCLDDLMAQYVHDILARGDAEDANDYLAAQPEFHYRVMAYGIMNHNLEYDRCIEYLDTISASSEEEQDFVNAQEIYLDYVKDIDGFILNSADSLILIEAGEKFNPYAGYARSIYLLLTGLWIEREFVHLDSSIVPRSDSKSNTPILQETVSIAPNPTSENTVTLFIDNLDADNIYALSVFNALGTLVSTQNIDTKRESVELSATPGIYLFVIKSRDRVIGTSRVIRL